MKKFNEYILNGFDRGKPALQVSLYLTVVFFCLLFSGIGLAQQNSSEKGSMEVGMARIDITPEDPIRLAGYASASRNEESEGVIHNLQAKALAFGSNAQEPSILITVDLIGIPEEVTQQLSEKLSKKFGMDPAQLVILASHTHGGPEVGNLLNILHFNGNSFEDSIFPEDQLIRIAEYRDRLNKKLEEVAVAAMEDRRPALVSSGVGQANFARNRREGGGPVDPALPLLRVTDLDGSLRAVLVNYACHGTTLPGDINEIHGDWMSEAQKLIEANHPGVMAMVSIGAGADINPEPMGTIENMKLHGKEISDNVDKLLSAQLQPLTTPPVGRMKLVELPFAHVPSFTELVEQTKENSVRGYYSRRALERKLRGHEIPETLSYPVQTWTFGNDFAMVNLAGEVVVDYAVRLKNDFGAERLWVNSYANGLPAYIASSRVIQEGGYEAEGSMYWYDKPSPFVEEVEDIIVNAVHDLLPSSFKTERKKTNKPELILPETNGNINLEAGVARTIGPNIAFMPEWEAFGWFTHKDRVEWEVEVKERAEYDVYLEWSVSDSEAGKPFIFEMANQKLSGEIGKTGSWFTFRTEKIGRVRLSPGRHEMVFKPGANTEEGALMDLREIKLIPVN